jgi:hypothetical protein
MRGAALPRQPKSGKELAFPSISICSKWIPHEFDIVTMLANSSFCHPVFGLVKFTTN